MNQLIIAFLLMVITCLFTIASIYYVRAKRYQKAAHKWKEKIWRPSGKARAEYDEDFGFSDPSEA